MVAKFGQTRAVTAATATITTEAQPLPTSPSAKFVAENEMLVPCKAEFGVSCRLGERTVNEVEPKSYALAGPSMVMVNGLFGGRIRVESKKNVALTVEPVGRIVVLSVHVGLWNGAAPKTVPCESLAETDVQPPKSVAAKPLPLTVTTYPTAAELID